MATYLADGITTPDGNDIDFPDKEEDILRLGEHYFKDLKANWVMASVYQQWLTARNLPTPPWFRNE